MIQQAYKYVSSNSCPWFNVLQAENHKHIEIKWEGTGKEWVAMETEFFIAVGVYPVELLAYQVSMVCAANWPTYFDLYT